MNSLKLINLKLLVAVLITFLFTIACNKNDSIYYDYVNKVQSYGGSALSYIEVQPKGTFDSLIVVLDRFPDLKDSLQNKELTLFLPVNKSFESAIKYLNSTRKRQDKEPLYLADVDEAQLDTLICRYVLRGQRLTVDYEESSDGLILESIKFYYPMHVRYEKMSSSGFVGGGASTVNFSNTFGSPFDKDWVTTKASTVNIRTNNAVINILDPIHNFGFDEFTSRLDN